MVSAAGSAVCKCTVCECEWCEASLTCMSAEMSDGDSEVMSGETMREADECANEVNEADALSDGGR